MKNFSLTLGMILIVGFAPAQLPTQTTGRDQEPLPTLAPGEEDVSSITTIEDEEESNVESAQEEEEIDSTDEDSVSKYNFLFYFLFQKKYNQDLD